MAAEQSARGQQAAAQRAMAGDGECGVLRTGGEILAAASAAECMQDRREPAVIEAEKRE
jgi:hypothetical protein